MPDRTYGERYRADNPGWPHECCHAERQDDIGCPWQRKDGLVRHCGAETPAACDFYCGKAEASCPR